MQRGERRLHRPVDRVNRRGDIFMEFWNRVITIDINLIGSGHSYLYRSRDKDSEPYHNKRSIGYRDKGRLYHSQSLTDGDDRRDNVGVQGWDVAVYNVYGIGRDSSIHVHVQDQQRAQPGCHDDSR